MQRDGDDVLFRKDILAVLQQRDARQVGSQLEAEIGKTFVDPVPGVRVDGVYRRAVDLASGRFALIRGSSRWSLGGRRWRGTSDAPFRACRTATILIERSAADVVDRPYERRHRAEAQ